MVTNLIYVVVHILIIFVVGNKVRRILKTICSNQRTLALIGGNKRRNVISFQDIIFCLQSYAGHHICMGIMFLLIDMKIIHASSVILFLWGSSTIIVLTLKDVFLPWRILMNGEDYRHVWEEAKINKHVNFHVRQPKIIPRRDFQLVPSTRYVIEVDECTD